MNGLSEVVPTDSLSTLEQLERTIEQGLKVLRQTFFEVGLALAEVKKRELYLAKGYSSYTSYCAGEWKINKTYAYDLLKAAEVVVNLIPQLESFPQSFSAIAEKLNYPLPRNESQCREIAKLKTAELQRQAWQEILESDENKITAKQIRHTVASFTAVSNSNSLTIPQIDTAVRIVGNNSDLKQFRNCWGIVLNRYEHSVDVATCLGMARTVHPQYLMVIRESDSEATTIVDRVQKIAASDLIDDTVRNLLREIATAPVPHLNKWQEIYLSATEEVIGCKKSSESQSR